MRKENILLVVVSVLASLVVMSPVAYMAYKKLPPQVAQVDLQTLLMEQTTKTYDVLKKDGGNISDEQRKVIEKLTIDFAKRLSEDIDALGQECGCVIVNKAAVLGGSVIDYTEIIRQRMKR